MSVCLGSGPVDEVVSPTARVPWMGEKGKSFYHMNLRSLWDFREIEEEEEEVFSLMLGALCGCGVRRPSGITRLLEPQQQ